MKRLILGTIVCTLVFPLLGLSGARATADSNSVTVDMEFISCAAMEANYDEKYLERAIHWGICSEDGSPTVSPTGTVFGTCGSSTLQMFDDGGGMASFYVAAVSTRGPMYEVVWNVPWNNYTTGRSGNIGANSYVGGGTTTWSDWVGVHTEPGTVGGVASGIVYTTQGTCYWLNPSDTVYVGS